MLRIDPKSQLPLYEQIIQQMKELVARGVLQPNDRIPSVRELSSQIIVNPNTVSKAYKELERQGVIITMRGRGTFIAEFTTEDVLPKDIERVKDQIQKAVLEGFYAGIHREEMKVWVEAFYKELGGDQDD
ncbi:GntR family transcriptional regulator [Salsuginibacillus kocurii]|uniref:GntR family transcriptional regulator n=1 Tax=Salsuginibacillus kocurii TaxID=427078 RepID=UPI00035E8A18|nr:GntR family transcriptional regulator [Salsuginibacillus kocurii]